MKKIILSTFSILTFLPTSLSLVSCGSKPKEWDGAKDVKSLDSIIEDTMSDKEVGYKWHQALTFWTSSFSP